MLVLTRKKCESIVIAGNVHIKIVEVKGKTVRLGIEAPREVSVRRAELTTTQPEHEPDWQLPPSRAILKR
jgi:carbon storage regulator